MGSLLFLAVAPGEVGGLIPWSLTGWHGTSPPSSLQALGLDRSRRGPGRVAVGLLGGVPTEKEGNEAVCLVPEVDHSIVRFRPRKAGGC